MNKISCVSAAAFFSVALLLGACDKGKDTAAAASGSGKAAATASAAAGADKGTVKASAKSGGGDLKATCEKICDKGVECAEDMAKGAGMPEDAIKTAKADAKKGLAECKKGCGDEAAKATDKDKAQVAKVDACLTMDCAGFSKCLETIE